MVRRHGFGITLNMNMNNIEQSLNRLVALVNAQDSTRIAGRLVGRLVNGAVGSFEINIAASPTNLPAGDPILAKITIFGRGALDNVELPRQDGESAPKSE